MHLPGPSIHLSLSEITVEEGFRFQLFSLVSSALKLHRQFELVLLQVKLTSRAQT